MSNPWSNQLVSLVVVTAPPGQYAGIFVYSPAPGPGTLIGSWAAQAGTDPYGNAYPQGLNVTTGSISGVTFKGNNFLINNSGMFLYSGTPALGNLIASITNAAGTDANGNAYLEGITSYEIAPSPNIAVQMDLGQIEFWRAASGAGPWSQINGLTLANSPNTNLIVDADLVVVTNLEVGTALQLGGNFGSPPTPPTLETDLWADGNSASGTISILKSNTMAGRIGFAQVDLSNFSNNNNTTAQPITKSWSLPANEFQANSMFSIECYFTGTFEASQLNIGYIQDGIFVNIVPVAAGAFGAGVGLVGMVKANFIFTAGGAGGSMDVNFTGEMSNSGVNRAPSTTLTLNGRNGAQVYDCTVAHTMAIGARWQAAVAGQTITGVDSTLQRKGV